MTMRALGNSLSNVGKICVIYTQNIIIFNIEFYVNIMKTKRQQFIDKCNVSSHSHTKPTQRSNRKPRNLPRIVRPRYPRGQTPTSTTPGETSQGGVKRSGTGAPRSNQLPMNWNFKTEEREKPTHLKEKPNKNCLVCTSQVRLLLPKFHRNRTRKYYNTALFLDGCWISLTGRFHRRSAAGWAECAVAGPGRARR